MCDTTRKTISDYESQFTNRCKELAKRKKPVNKELQDFIHWMFIDLRGLEKTLAIPAVKTAVELAGQIDGLQDKLEDLQREVNRLDNDVLRLDNKIPRSEYDDD